MEAEKKSDLEMYRDGIALYVSIVGPHAVGFVARQARSMGMSVMLDESNKLVEVFSEADVILTLRDKSAEKFFAAMERAKNGILKSGIEVSEMDLALATVFRSFLDLAVSREGGPDET